ncbi:hypothetical protein Patl1_33168 [Pistacia atlantica]|uniref:Uncharacterized protein n=1 Tax=Pistacia atlantica TaxID=434234 RepID=A0ACC1AMR4_9ROSI|nr:hypothetical protein Patl1_33168 [Pistacia atlantica]
MIGGYAQSSSPVEAIVLFIEAMLSDEIDFDETHAYLLRHGIHFEGMESYLIDMYAKSGLIRASQQNFERNHLGDRDQVHLECYDCWVYPKWIGSAFVDMYSEWGQFLIFEQLLSACSYAGLVDEGLQIFELMESKYKIQPSTKHYCCVVDMLGYVNRFASKDQEHPQSDEIYETLEGLAMEMKNAGYRANLSSNLDAISQFNE